MASWFLVGRSASGKPTVAAMSGSKAEKLLEGDLKANLIAFLNTFSGAGTFLIAKPDANPDGSDTEVESVALLPRNDATAPKTTTTPPVATWFQFFRGQAGDTTTAADLQVVVAMNGSSPVEFYKGNLKQALIDFLNRFSGANTFQVAPDDTALNLTAIPEWKPGTIAPPTGRRVLLEVGHGSSINFGFDPGAIAHDGTTTEHSLNIIAASAAREFLSKNGVFCTITDGPQDSLFNLGQKASGFDVFCSIHHNALRSGQSVAQRSEAFAHSTKGGAKDDQLANFIADELSQALNILNGGGKRLGLGILSGAETTNVKAAVLAEVYFIDFVGGTVGGKSFPKPNLKQDSKAGGEAIGKAILKWLKANP
jgi:N-acetylmuramoyl-L-alanine amidase